MRLVNPSDADLQEAFAVNVAKWTFITFPYGVCPNKKHWFDSAGKFVSIHLDGRFTTSADAVLPWLEKAGRWSAIRRGNGEYEIELDDLPMPEAGHWWAINDSFPKAAVLALLRAHGVEIEFTQ